MGIGAFKKTYANKEKAINLDVTSDSDVEIVNNNNKTKDAKKDDDSRDGSGDNADATNEATVKEGDEKKSATKKSATKKLPSKKEEDGADQGPQIRTQLLYAEVAVELLETLVAQNKEIIKTNNNNQKLLQKLLNHVAETEIDAGLDELSQVDYNTHALSLMHICHQERNKASIVKGLTRKTSLLMVKAASFLKSKDNGDSDDDTRQTPAEGTSTMRKDAGVKPNAKRPLQDSNVNSKRSKN
ncbi:hypothetical protein E3Q23_04434 [Wallemia mellicola]|uniref:Uncharacterized protein n=1 Tax=Wallemia mellicola TaxID=1708541 RepID=A0A4T0LF94_9BASI|nr:hypothetical protein E3Q23_04434 [Wallemia mellicola]TIC63819.1 hypothetical protein E3Q01_03133 [Wallemia mellicola]